MDGFHYLHLYRGAHESVSKLQVRGEKIDEVATAAVHPIFWPISRYYSFLLRYFSSEAAVSCTVKHVRRAGTINAEPKE